MLTRFSERIFDPMRYTGTVIILIQISNKRVILIKVYFQQNGIMVTKTEEQMIVLFNDGHE